MLAVKQQERAGVPHILFFVKSRADGWSTLLFYAQHAKDPGQKLKAWVQSFCRVLELEMILSTYFIFYYGTLLYFFCVFKTMESFRM
jgi:hypothetical protein